MAYERQTIKEITQKSPWKKYSMTLATYFVIFFLGLFAVRPTLITISRVRKEVAQKRIINNQLDNKITSFTSLKQDYINIKTQLDNLELIFPATGDFSLFLANVENICLRNNFVMQSISFTENASTSEAIDKTLNYKVLSTRAVSIVVLGHETNLLSLLQDFESLPMYPEITGVSFGENVDDNGMQTITIELRLYKITDPKFYEK